MAKDPVVEAYGLVVKNLRLNAGLTHRDVADEHSIDRTYLVHIESGNRFPSIQVAETLDTAFGSDLPSRLREMLDVLRSTKATSNGRTGPLITEDDMDERRRRLLASLGALGTGAVISASALEGIREALTAALPDADETSVSDWEEIVAEYGFAFLTTPLAELLPDMAVDVVTLQHLIGTAPNEHRRRDLCRPGGQLAMLMAMTTGALGSVREARHWWQTARRACDVSGDADLRAWVRGYEAMQALYLRRPMQVVLNRADEAINIIGTTRTASGLEAMAARAQALAALGRDREALEAVQDMEAVFTRLPGGSAYDRISPTSWPETGLRHTQGWVYTHVGHPKASLAQDAALALYPSPMRRQRVQIQLLQANTLVQAGHIGEGVTLAQDAVEALPANQRTVGIRQGAHAVLAVVPDTETHRPVVSEYREYLALPAAN